MADRYYDAQATGANNGTSKLDAFDTINAAALAMSETGGDSLWCSHTSNETKISHLNTNFGIGNRIICVDFSGSTPPVSADWTTGCFVNSNNGLDITFLGSAYFFGVKFSAGDDMTMGGERLVFEQCELSLLGNSDNLILSSGECLLKNSIYSGGGTDHEILAEGGHFAMQGGSILFGGKLAILVRNSGRESQVEFHGTDLSNGGNGINRILSAPGSGRCVVTFDSCNVDTSALIGTSNDIGQVNFYGSNIDDKSYYIQETSFYGTVQSETTIVKTGGSSDGTTPISLKFVGNAENTSHGMGIFLDLPIHFWCDDTGNQTFELELLTDGVTLTEEDFIMELIFPQAGEAGKVFASSRTFDGANLAASIVGWTTTGIGVPIKQKISMTVNIGQVGVVQARLSMKKQNTIVYADMKLLPSNRQFVAGQAFINAAPLSCDFPAVGDVTEGTVFDGGNLTGTYKEVPESKAEFGFDYGAGGVEFTGSLAAFTAEYELPQEIILEDQEILIFEGCD